MFLTRKIDAISPSADDDFWYNNIGMVTASGQRVSPEHAMQLTAVYSCVKVLAETLAQLPLHLFRRLDDEGKERAFNHPLYNILHNRPNQWQTSYEWREMMQGHATLRGNGYSKIIASGNGRIMQLIPMHPDHVKLEMLSDTNWRYHHTLLDGTTEILTRGEVFHIRGLSYNGILGINPIEAEREAVGIGIASQEYGATFYKNGAVPGGVIEWEGHFDGKTETGKKFKQSFQESQTGLNRHKTAVLERGMKYHELALKHTDAQYLETRKFQTEEIARIFRVPPHKIGHLERSTNNNIEHQSIEFVTDTMMPWLVRWEQAITRDLIVRENDFFAEFSVDGLLRGDSKSRAEFYSKAIASGWMMRNEARVKENMNKKDGLSEPLTPVNMTTGIGGAADVDDTDSPDDSADTDSSEATVMFGGEISADVEDNIINALQAVVDDDRIQAIIFESAKRIANKEIIAAKKAYKKYIADEEAWVTWVNEFYSSKHIELVSKTMAINTASAEAYVKFSRADLIIATADEVSTKEPAILTYIESLEKDDTKAKQIALLR
jgi:HK97 family phage portal protein